MLDLRAKLKEAEDIVNMEIASAEVVFVVSILRCCESQRTPLSVHRIPHCLQSRASRAADLAVLKTEIDDMRADMRATMAEVSEVAGHKYSMLVTERDSRLSELHRARNAAHDTAMSLLPYWMVRFDHMRDYAWNHGHTHAGGWRSTWKPMVAEVAELFADDGDKAELIPALEEALVNVNAWSGAQMKQHLSAVRARAHELDMASGSRCVCVCVCVSVCVCVCECAESVCGFNDRTSPFVCITVVNGACSGIRKQCARCTPWTMRFENTHKRCELG